MLACAGAYVSGAAGSNECPAGSVRIETEAACRTAVTAAGKIFDGVSTDPEFPRGCQYYTRSDDAFFNVHAVGAGRSISQLLCATVDTTGAPLPRRRRTDARSACTGARACRHRAWTVRHSQAVCIIHGRHIDTHTYINRYIFPDIYPYDADGARRRCRAAQGSAGGRRTGGHGRGHVRVREGYSKRGTQTRCSKRGTQKGLLKKGYSIAGTQKKGCAKGVVKSGTQKK